MPEFSSIKDFISALLIPSSFPVTKKVLFLSKPFFFCSFALLIDSKFSNSLKTFKFVLLEKKFLIELICVSPIPSIFNKSSYLTFCDNSLNLGKDPKYFDNTFAFSNPMCRIPKE